MIKSKLIDGRGSKNSAIISNEGALNVVVHPHPPPNEVVTTLPFRQFFTDTGDSSGSNDMVINGETNNADFYISAVPEFDIYINSISVLIGDGGSPNLNSFGALNSLTNGVEWVYFSDKEGNYQLHDGIKTNLEFIRLGMKTAGIGTGVDAFLADVSGGATEKSYIPIIDISDTFGMPWGIRLKKGTTDKLIFKVKDNLSNLTTFNIIAYGIRQD